MSDLVAFEELKPALLIVNPVSGKKLILKYVSDIVAALTDGGYKVTVMITGKRGDGREYTMKYGEHFDLICCTGGDGSLNEVITGLALSGLKKPVGYVPCGSTNVFAMGKGYPEGIPNIAKAIANGRTQRIDVGQFGKEYFSFVAAFGAFSAISYTTDQKAKNMFGHSAYLFDGIRSLSTVKPLHMKFLADGKVHEDEYIFGAICNASTMSGIFELPADIVDLSDGKFEVFLVHKPTLAHGLDEIALGIFRQDFSAPVFDVFQAKSIEVFNPDLVPWTVDGEKATDATHYKVKCLHNFLNLRL